MKNVQRYPLVMHKKNEDGSFLSGHIVDAAHEATATANGWTLTRPPLPEPEPEKVALTLEERVTALEDAFNLTGQALRELTELVAEIAIRTKGKK